MTAGEDIQKEKGKLLIMRYKKGVLSCLMSGSRALWFHADPANESGLGNIYIGKIRNIAKNLNAAFVDIAPGETCYLPLEEAEAPVYTRKGSSRLPQAGDELLVQVSREAMKTKAPAVSTKLNLHGRYAVLIYPDHRKSVSSGLDAGQRKRLREQLPDLLAELDSGENSAILADTGWILRTNAAEVPAERIRSDMERLLGQLRRVLETAQFRTCYSCLFREPPAWLRRMEDSRMSEAETFLTDDEELYEVLKTRIMDYYPEDIGRLSFYRDPLLSMWNLYRIERELERATQRRVWLPSGGYLMIDPTEALTAIDVNTGKDNSKKKKEELFHRTNREAAEEIARQIRLRNLSGIIIIDFINEEEAQETELCGRLKALIEKDPVRTVLVDRTKLHLVEITRMKKEKTLEEALRDIS